MATSRVHRLFLSAFLMTFLSAIVSRAEYHFSANHRMVYDVKITAELPDQKQTISGNLFYTIKSVDPSEPQASVNFFTTLHLNSSFSSNQHNGPFFQNSSVLPFANIGIDLSRGRDIVVSQSGRVIEYGAEDQLPYMLGNAWDLGVASSPSDQKQSNTQQIIDLQNRFSNFPRAGFASQEHRTAMESVSYSSAAPRDGAHVIDVKYQLVSDETSNGASVIRDTGSGQIAFDPQSGWVQTRDMSYHILYRQNHVTMDIPVEVHVKLLGSAEAQHAWQMHQDAFALAMKEQAERNAPKLLDNDSITAALEKLTSQDAFKVRDACEQLEHAIVVKSRQSEVARALEPLMKHSEEMVRIESTKALAVWAERKNIPSLSEGVHSTDIFVRQGAIEALGHIHDRRAAEIVASQLPDNQVQFQAEQALISIGPVAEPAVLPMLKNENWVTRLSACKILAAIGTQHSLGDLQTVSNKDDNGLVSQEADKAEQAIRDRAESKS
ncbi:MAG TPA: HEAT repeat domain-containing protein [Tepidisphaeraceae bacterium]